jgi:hypothetical protein
MVGETTLRRQPVAGDIVVTKIANHYNVDRAAVEGTPALVKVIDTLSDALTLACQLVSGSERVFFYPRSNYPDGSAIDCAKPFWLK